MKQTYFKKLETHDSNLPIELTKVTEQRIFNEQGLKPIITQDATTKTTLMFV